MPGYIIVQLVGATLACLFLWAVFGKLGSSARPSPARAHATGRRMLMELVLTLGLVSVILGTASAPRTWALFAALGVGGYIILAGLWSSPVSGASMNPARSFGPDLVSG